MTGLYNAGRALAILAVVSGVAGCATLSPDGGFDEIGKVTRARGGVAASPARNEAEAAAGQRRVEEILAKPLTPDGAVEIALLNSPGLRTRLAEVGIAEADLVQAGRMRNPSFSFSRKGAGDVLTIERSLIINIASGLTIPLALEVEKRRFSQAQLTAAIHVLQTAAAARQAFFRAVAAEERARYFAQVRMASEASAELARRMQEAGNFSALQRMREQAAYADTTTQLARARHNALVERENLIRLLGLWAGQIAVQLPERLPDLPPAAIERPDAERVAIETRLDVQVARTNAEAAKSAIAFAKAYPFLNLIESGGYINESDTGEATKQGYEFEFQLPIFDWGDGHLARSEALYRQAVARADEIAVNARSEVRENYSNYRTTYDIAKHYREEIVPLRKRIAEENLLRYNGMLIGVFELLADAREQIVSVSESIDALRDFWLADTALQIAMTTASPGSMTPSLPSAMPSAAPAGGH